MQPLSPRQQSILNRVIESHIETGQPVGSRTLTQLYTGIYQSSYSPATVRYEMGELEKKGYLTHPHTSAGRIPTDLGYRYYVDSLGAHSVEETLDRDLEAQLRGAASENEDFADKASSYLASLLKQLVLILVPTGRRYRPFFRGTRCFMEKPEFQDRSTVSLVLEDLENPSELIGWLLHERQMEKSLQVWIGSENRRSAFRKCSVITAFFPMGGESLGALAVIGPRRMDYAKNIPVIRQVIRVLNIQRERIY